MKQMLITGASRGIGRACAEHFKDTFEVIGVGRSFDGSEDFKVDKKNLTDQKDVQDLIDTYNPDIFINNAGVIGQDINRVLHVNYMAACKLAGEFHRKMQEGHIVNIGSIAGNVSGHGFDYGRVWYAASKAGLHEFSRYLNECGQNEVKVTSLEIGSVKTSIGNAFHNVEIPESEYEQQTMTRIPMKVQDVVNAIEWVLNQPQYITIPTLEVANFVKPRSK